MQVFAGNLELKKMIGWFFRPKKQVTLTLRQQKIVRRITLTVFAVIGIWAYGLNYYVNNLPSKPNEDQSMTDGIVIFTGGAMRLGAAIELLNQDKAERMMISGVGGGASLDVLLMLSGKLPDNIVELKKRIDVGYEAKSTRGNAVEVEKWVQEHKYKTIRLVTANYHMPRSYFELSNAMPDVKIIENPVFPEDIQFENWWTRGVTKKIMFSEYNKYIASRLLALMGM